MDPLPALTRAQVREVDRRALEELSMPGVVLMENAGRAAAEALLRLYPQQLEHESRTREVLILCGRGNNGGDGYVLARHLDIAGAQVRVLESAAPEELSADAAVFREACRALGLNLVSTRDDVALEAALASCERPVVFVDALLGTGFCGQVLREPEAAMLAAVQRWTSETNTPVVALDLPSGMDADSGAAAPQTLRCDHTLTFVAPKLGFETEVARSVTGATHVLGIGLPAPWVARVL